MTAPPRLLARPSALPPELMRALSGAPGEPTATELTELASTLGGALGVALPVPVVAKALPVATSAALAGGAAAGGAAAGGAAAGGAAAGGAAAGVLATKPLAVFGAWLVGGLALGAGLSGLASSFLSLDSPAPRERPAASVGVRSATPDATAARAENPAVVPDALPALPSAQRSQDVGVFGGQRPVARETEHALAAPAVASESELSLLKRAREAEPTQALALTAEHARRFPTGALEQEREMIAIDALLRLGRRDVAEQRAKRFQAQYPGSAHARRLSALFDSSTP